MTEDLHRDISPHETEADADTASSIRPIDFSEFVGQRDVIDQLHIAIEAAKKREEPIDHTIFYGPPGLGKTTLSRIIAKEMGSNIRCISGPMLAKPYDLIAILTSIGAHDVLFIDEIHRLTTQTEEFLYSAMEDYSIDIIIGEGSSARVVKVTLPQFTLVGATTRLGLLTNPLKDRFGIQIKVSFYSEKEICQILKNLERKMQIQITDSAVQEIAARSRGTPRVAIRLLKRTRDLALVKRQDIINDDIVKNSMNVLQIDDNGLDELDKRYLSFIRNFYRDTAVGVDTIAAGISEDKSTIEDMIEPYLMQRGLILRTARGRKLTQEGVNILEII